MLNSAAQPTTTIYCLPGQGSDKRIFERLTLDPCYRVQVIEYGTPAKHQTMASFAKDLVRHIDTTQPYVLVGMSLGGMLAVELSEILEPQKTIIISSAKNRNELPFRYKFQRAVPVYKIVPASMLLGGAKLLQPIVEPDRKKYKATFKSMLGSKGSTYMKRTIDMIMTWERTSNTRPVVHIHGDNDHTLPIRKIKAPDFVVDKGSHMMTLTRAEEISKILNEVLAGESLEKVHTRKDN